MFPETLPKIGWTVPTHVQFTKRTTVIQEPKPTTTKRPIRRGARTRAASETNVGIFYFLFFLWMGTKKSTKTFWFGGDRNKSRGPLTSYRTVVGGPPQGSRYVMRPMCRDPVEACPSLVCLRSDGKPVSERKIRAVRARKRRIDGTHPMSPPPPPPPLPLPPPVSPLSLRRFCSGLVD